MLWTFLAAGGLFIDALQTQIPRQLRFHHYSLLRCADSIMSATDASTKVEHDPIHTNQYTANLDTLSTRRCFLSFAATLTVSLLPNSPAHAGSLSAQPTANKSETVSQESISGFVAGGLLTATKTAVKYPLDTATVRLQMPDTDYSVLQIGKLMAGSYRGILSPLLWNIPAGAVFFAVKDATKQSLTQQGDLPKWAATMVAVLVAQYPYWAVRNPSEVVKTKLQAGTEGYGEGVSSWDAFQLVKDRTSETNNSTGLEGFYVGYWENILYAYPADVIKFVVYDQLTGGRKDLSPLNSALAGAAATALAQFATTPLDVVRNRIMAGTNVEAANNVKPSYADTLIALAKDEGLNGLFAGATPRVGKAILSGAIQFATYEETKQLFAKYFQART